MSNEPSTTTQAKWADLLSGRNALLTIALTGGVALHAINIYIVTTILPSIVNDIGGLEYYAWNTTIFVATSIVGSTLSSKILNQLGPKFAYLTALLIFSLGSIWCALSPSMLMLLGGRALQGLGGGILFALSYALIRVVFTENLWSRAIHGHCFRYVGNSDTLRSCYWWSIRSNGSLALGFLVITSRCTSTRSNRDKSIA